MTIVNKNEHIYPIIVLFNGWECFLISYEPFWEMLKKRNITTYTLINKYNISSATIDRMKKGNGISTMKINDFCKILDCNVEDIIKYEKE